MNTLYACFAAALFAFALGYKLGDKHATEDAEFKAAKSALEAAEAEKKHKDAIRALEERLTEATSNAAQAFEMGKRDAEANAASTVADLRAGNLRLQQRWAGCEAERLSEATPAPSEPDAAARDREESAGRIVRAAAECDAQVRGLQSLVAQWRMMLNEPR